jgi:adenylate cyclase
VIASLRIRVIAMKKGIINSAVFWRHASIRALICAVSAAVLALAVWTENPNLERMELGLGDLLTENRGGGTINDQLVLIGIDQQSLNVLDVLSEEEVTGSPVLDEMSFGWPFPRTVHAAVVEKLLAAGARAVVLDVIFSGEREEDPKLKAVLDAHPRRFVIAFSFDSVESLGGRHGFERFDVKLPSPSVIEREGPMDPRIGFATLFPDLDGRVRSITPTRRQGDREDSPVFHSMAYAALKQLDLAARIPEPDRDYHIRFSDYSGDPPPYSWVEMYTLFVDSFWEKNYGGGEAFRDKIVYVGGTSIDAFHDVASIPGHEVRGVQLQMNALAAALNGEFYTVFSKREQFLSILAAALVAFGGMFVMKRPLVGFGLLIGCGALYLFAVSWVYSSLDALLPSATPILTLSASGIFSFGYQFSIERLEKARLRRTLERQVSKELAEHILSMPEDFFNSMPGVRKPVTILFSDIRGFTTRSEKDDVVELVVQLREYLDAMANVVFKHGGVVDKFIGDAVMAVWGNYSSAGVEVDARRAAAAAVEMLDRLAELNEEWRAAGREPFEIGIGINHGEALFAMMGSEQKQEMTVIGDPVNQAARLEGLTKKFGVKIVIGESVAEFVKTDFNLRSFGAVRTKGKDRAAELFSIVYRLPNEPRAALDQEMEWVRSFHAALGMFRKGDFASAETQFRRCQSEVPNDPVCELYLEHIAAGEQDRVLTMSEK